MNNYKLVAPDIDSLLNCFERGSLNPSAPSEALCKAMDPLFEMLREMAPLRKNDEAKAIWVTIPRGAIEDFGSYEDMLEWGDVKNREEYEQYWLEEYPDHSLTGRKPSLLSALFLRNRSWNPCGG